MTGFVARQLALRPFPHGTEAPGSLGDHIMGMAVLGWLTEFPIATWGESWMRRGALQVTFARPVVAGQALDMHLSIAESAIDMSYRDDGGRACVTGRATIDADEPRSRRRPDIDSDGAAIAIRRTPRASDLRDAVFPPMTFSFDASRDLAFLDGQADAYDWRERGWAHPAWLGTATNAAIMRNIDFSDRGESTGRWQQVSAAIDMIDPIVDGDEVTMHARIDRLSTRGRTSQHHVAHLTSTFRVGSRVVARFSNDFVFATDNPSPDPPHP